MTTLKDDATSMMEDLSSGLSSLDDTLTQNGNVTDNNSSTGLFEDMTTDKTTEKTTSKSSTTTSEASHE